MKIGILGAGNIGATLAQRLSAASYRVAIADSRPPAKVDLRALGTGATAVWAHDVVDGADVVITSVGFGQVPAVASVVRGAPVGAIVIDTSITFRSATV